MLNAGIEESSSHIRIKHTRTAKERLDFGSEMLRIAMEYAKTSELFYESLLTIKMTDDQVRDYIARLQLTPSQYNEIVKTGNDYAIRKLFDKDWLTLQKFEISTQKSNTISTIFDYYKNGVAQESISGTAWGAYNAITGYYSNIKTQEGEKRMNNLVFDEDRLATRKNLNEVTMYKEAI